MSTDQNAATLIDYEPDTQVFLDDVSDGLRQTPKTLPCKYFYDRSGSKLFDEICELDEYYLTRTELAIMNSDGHEMAEQIGAGVMLVEYGSGSSTKTRILLDELEDPVAYVPVDISRTHLQLTANELSVAYPDIKILPVCADFTQDFELPVSRRAPTHCAVYFPGSTIGNFQPTAARRVLERIAPLCGRGGGLLIGIDLKKDVSVLEAAYNDDRGVTARFNKNLLCRINRELGADFEIDQFSHRAVYNREMGRVEMLLESLQDQRVNVGDESFTFSDGETICTEHSHKYTVDEFSEIAADAGLTPRRVWKDEDELFGVLHFAVV